MTTPNAGGREVRTVTDNSDTPHSSSGSGRIPQAVLGFLEDVPERAWIRSLGLMVATTDPAIVGKWVGDRANYCNDIEGFHFSLPQMVREFRPSSSSRVMIDGLEWWQTTWKEIPTRPQFIDSLVIRTKRDALFFVPTAIPVQHQNGRGSWSILRAADLLTNGRLWLHVRTEVHKWEIQLKFLPEDDGSTTALVLTRRVPEAL